MISTSRQPSEISSAAFFIAAGYRLSFKTYASRGRSAVIKSFMRAPWGLVAASRAALLNPRDGHAPTNGEQLAFCFMQFGREQKHLIGEVAELLA